MTNTFVLHSWPSLSLIQSPAIRNVTFCNVMCDIMRLHPAPSRNRNYHGVPHKSVLVLGFPCVMVAVRGCAHIVVYNILTNRVKTLKSTLGHFLPCSPCYSGDKL